MPEFERVHTMTDYYDGPRVGIADYLGQPHIYESLFDNGELDLFRLSPLDNELFQLALEDWEIWLRWEAAFHAGLTPHETHPALPADRVRHHELAPILKQRLVIDEMDFVTARGEFRVIDHDKSASHNRRSLEVKWTRTESHA